MSEVELNSRRDSIANLAEHMQDLPQVECPVKHHFAPGVYIREIFMPEDSYVIGKIHSTEHFNIILSGRVSVFTTDGWNDYKAGDTFVSKAGVQKVVYMHTDCSWQTVHVTNETDIKAIEKQVIVESYDKLQIDSLLQEAKGVVTCLGDS